MILQICANKPSLHKKEVQKTAMIFCTPFIFSFTLFLFTLSDGEYVMSALNQSQPSFRMI